MEDTDALVSELYALLRRRAERLVARAPCSLSPTSLVHDVWMKLYRADPAAWESKEHFRAVAARAMRQILVDRARSRGTAKRGGGWERVALSGVGTRGEAAFDVVALHEALEKLEAARPRTAEVVTLRLLGALEVEEVADLMSLSPSTVKREWRSGRAWLSALLEPDESTSS